MLLILFAALAATAYRHIATLLVPAAVEVENGENHREKVIEIPYASSTASIAELLEEEGIIGSALLFRFYARYLGYEQELQAGRYALSSTMSMKEILQELRRGVVYQDTIRFTVPEGFNLEQTGARLDETGLADLETFLEACAEYQNDDFPFLDEIPQNVYFRLEGYLFPDTYEVFPDAEVEDIITLMLRRFKTVCDEGYGQQAADLGLSLHEAVTLASLVEKEGQVLDEMPLISAVFHNRLQKEGMPLLQSCATVQYALGETKPYLTYEDLRVESLYNTYIHPALPPGPIAAPGQRALEAAVNPAAVDYLYFVSREDGSGAHYFSTTLQEHNRHKAMAQQNRN